MSEPSLDKQALEILNATRDGNDLAPQHLKLVEMAVNGFLNEKGQAAFHELVQNVRDGYKPPWFHDIEHLTIDHTGYVYWKGKQIDHFTPRWAYTDEAKKVATELAARCRHLEYSGAEVNATNAVWTWEDFLKEQPKESGQAAEGKGRA